MNITESLNIMLDSNARKYNSLHALNTIKLVLKSLNRPILFLGLQYTYKVVSILNPNGFFFCCILIFLSDPNLKISIDVQQRQLREPIYLCSHSKLNTL